MITRCSSLDKFSLIDTVIFSGYRFLEFIIFIKFSILFTFFSSFRVHKFRTCVLYFSTTSSANRAWVFAKSLFALSLETVCVLLFSHGAQLTPFKLLEFSASSAAAVLASMQKALITQMPILYSRFFLLP